MGFWGFGVVEQCARGDTTDGTQVTWNIGMDEDESLEMLVGSVSNSIEELKKVEDENYSVYNDAWTEMK